MLTTISAPHGPLSAAQARELVPRAATRGDDVFAVARQLVEDVKLRGIEALHDHAHRLDGGYAESLRVPAEILSAAEASLDPALRESISEAITRVTAASRAQVPAPVITEVAPGAIVEQHWVPVERVGLYVPGGKAVYPSSVVMNVVAARVAGVDSIALASPGQPEFGFSVHPTIAATAHMLGVTEVYAIGGASAIGALAFGVPELGLEPVSVITGPGTPTSPPLNGLSPVWSESTRRRGRRRFSSSPTTRRIPTSSPRTWCLRLNTTNWRAPCS